MTEKKKPYGTVLFKASAILDALAGSPDPLAMKEISNLSGLTMPTASKVLSTLEQIGFVKRDAERRYSLGGKLIHLASASFMQFDIVRESHPALKHLYNRFKETVHLGMLQDGEVLYINKMSPASENKKMLSRIGHTQELYCSAMGKALLAAADPETRENYLKNVSMTAKTEQTITDKNKLQQQLRDIKEQGYAIDDREAEEHVYCVGAVIKSAENSNDLYAFSVSLPYEKITDKLKQKVIEEVIKAKNIIEFQLETTGLENY